MKTGHDKERGRAVGDSDPKDPSKVQPIDAAKLQMEDIEPGSPPRIAGMSFPPPPHEDPIDPAHAVPGAGPGPASSEPTGSQPYLPEGRGPGQRGGPAMRADGEPGPAVRSKEEIERRQQPGPTPGRRRED